MARYLHVTASILMLLAITTLTLQNVSADPADPR
jgi:hypothetical protein